MKTVLTTLNAKYIHSSLALRYLKAYAQTDFPETEVVEYTIHDVPINIVSDLYRRRPDVIAFSVYIWNVEQTLPIVDMLRAVLPDCRIVLGGPEVSYDLEHWLTRSPATDVIVYGEGEATFHHLLETFQTGGHLSDVPGIAYREDGRFRKNPPRAKLDMSTIPSPYDDADLPSMVNRIVYFESSRGCPFSCQFCLSSIESGVRYFPLERVKSELMRLVSAGIRTIKFVDRTFNLNRNYAVELFQFLIDNRRDTVFQFEITGDILPTEIVDFLAENAPPGLFRFEIGVQSTNDVTNTLVQRRQNFAKLSRTILGIKQSGKIVQHLDLIAGLPEEDFASFRKTFNDVFAFEPEELQLGFLKMLRGTGLRHRAAAHGYVFMQNAPYEILHNDVLSFDDVIAIKQVEDVLDKYWNSGKLLRTIQFLTRYAFASPFDFFQSFGRYWTERGWDRIGHQLEDLFVRLKDFLSTVVSIEHQERAESWMIYDFLMTHRVRPQKLWWRQPNWSKSDWSTLLNQMVNQPERVSPDFAAAGLTYNDLDKHALLVPLQYAIDPGSDERQALESPTLLIVHYPPRHAKHQPPRVFTVALRDLSVSFGDELIHHSFSRFDNSGRPAS